MNPEESQISSSPASLPISDTQSSFSPAADALKIRSSEERTLFPVFNGVIGALLGSIPGIVVWIILGQMGYIAGIAGWLMIIGAKFGYKKLAGGIDKLGSVLSLIISLLMPIVSEYLGLAVSVYRAFHAEYAVTVGQALQSVPYYLGESDVVTPIISSLVIGYILVLAVYFSSNAKNRKQQKAMPDLTRK